MFRCFSLTLFRSLIIGLATLGWTLAGWADESAYNKGVNAWRSKNYEEARVQWRQSLAEGGPDEALNNLAYLLYHGLGGDTQTEKAIELWRKAAALAISEAQVHLGYAYEQGVGVERNLVQAFAWYQCAIVTAGGQMESDATEREIRQMAMEQVVKLEPRLLPASRLEGERLAREFTSKYSKRLALRQP